jgi:hypothetical protein
MKNALVVLCLVPAIAFAAQGAEKAKARPFIPGVNWEARTIRATGRGAPSLKAPSIAAARLGAEKAAEMDALRNILAAIQGVQISSEQTVGQAMNSDGALRAKLQGQAKGFRRVDTRYFSDGGVEIDVEMGIEELLAEFVPAQEQAAAPVLPTTGDLKNTGLIVDAKGLAAKPALAPRLLDEAGKEVYASNFVVKDALKANGIAGYLKSVDEAKASARVGERPLVVKAVRLAGASDLVLSDADAAQLRDPQGNVSFLGEGRVIIVAD